MAEENFLCCPREHPLCFCCVKELIQPVFLCPHKRTEAARTCAFMYKCPVCRSCGAVSDDMILTLLKNSWDKAAETARKAALQFLQPAEEG